MASWNDGRDDRYRNGRGCCLATIAFLPFWAIVALLVLVILR